MAILILSEAGAGRARPPSLNPELEDDFGGLWDDARLTS